jgi:hypothetical protein
LYYANQPTQPAKYRIGTDTRSSYTVTEAQYDAGVGANPTKWSITGWSDVTPAVYFAGQPTTPSKYRTNGLRSTWAAVTQQQYDTYNVNSGETDGWRTQSSSATYVSKAVYTANNTTADMSDGWWDTGSNEYIASGSATDWEVWTASRSGIPSDQLRSSKVYNSPPYEAYDPAVTASTANSVILARMIAGNDYGTPAIFNGTSYTNADVADMYTLPNWSQMQTALQAVALGECGGTLTLQTKKNGSPVADPFRYQNSAVADSSGVPLQIEPTVVTTNQQFTTGTFDLDVSNGLFVTVDVLPQNYSELGAYTPGSWACKAGNQPRAFTLIDIPGTNWKGVRVNVAANEAVACTLTVS